ncbi:hypothetical protein R1sor_026881 [Riccia sorocarpa]|uniref:Uncharacterized protein n=1 Tax=Riccia sorocarpa TaxID=122646 RepID=A0ABD3GCL8_9MARC
MGRGKGSLLESGRHGFWLGMLISIGSIFVVVTYVLYFQPCDFLSSELCRSGTHIIRRPVPVAVVPERTFTDDEITARAVAKDVLSRRWNERPPVAKIAFMFMTPGPLPFEPIWHEFFKGHEGFFTIYVHASENSTVERKSPYFTAREIPSKKVFGGRIDTVDAERRLLARALLDSANMFFVLLSEWCIPLYDFNYVYTYLMNAETSFVDSFEDPGPQGRGRYLDKMQPEIRPEDWRKGAQWIAVHRKHAIIIVWDHVYYNKFRRFCKPGVEQGNFNCVPHEHYIPTFLHIIDPAGTANRSLTYADWSEGKWQPRSFGKDDLTPHEIMKMQVIETITHKTSEQPAATERAPCMWGGKQHPCYLFARRFKPDALEVLKEILPNIVRSPL